MLGSLRRYKSLAIVSITLILFLGVGNVSAQVSEFKEIQDDIATLQQRADFAYEKVNDLTSTDAINRSSFFSVTNPGLWGLWILLLGSMLLLLAIRRNIVDHFYSRPRKKVSDGMKSASKATSVDNTHIAKTKKKLVKPEKTVKIKVRKVVKRRNTK